MILKYFYEQVRECALKRNFEQHIPIYLKKKSLKMMIYIELPNNNDIIVNNDDKISSIMTIKFCRQV